MPRLPTDPAMAAPAVTTLEGTVVLELVVALEAAELLGYPTLLVLVGGADEVVGAADDDEAATLELGAALELPPEEAPASTAAQNFWTAGRTWARELVRQDEVKM